MGVGVAGCWLQTADLLWGTVRPHKTHSQHSLLSHNATPLLPLLSNPTPIMHPQCAPAHRYDVEGGASAATVALSGAGAGGGGMGRGDRRVCLKLIDDEQLGMRGSGHEYVVVSGGVLGGDFGWVLRGVEGWSRVGWGVEAAERLGRNKARTCVIEYSICTCEAFLHAQLHCI